MAEITQYECDVCKTLKGAGNRWLIGFRAKHGYALADWPESMRDFENAQTLCSETCAQKELAKHLRRDREVAR